MDISQIPLLVRAERFGYQLIKTATPVASVTLIILDAATRDGLSVDELGTRGGIGAVLGALWYLADWRIKAIEVHYATGPWPRLRRPRDEVGSLNRGGPPGVEHEQIVQRIGSSP